MINLRTIQAQESKAAIAVMDTVIQEIWQVSLTWLMNETNEFNDLLEIQSFYFDNQGTFMVLEDDGHIVGIGAIGRINEERAELKRIWLLNEYRGRGLGRRLVAGLLDFARAQGYQVIELSVYSPSLQMPAVNLYNSFGFRTINLEENDLGENKFHMEMAFK